VLSRAKLKDYAGW